MQVIFKRNNFLLLFIIISILVIILLQVFSALRIPLIIGHISLLFFLTLKFHKLDGFLLTNILLIVYVIIQSFALQEIVSIVDFVQAIISILLYVFMYCYTKSIVEKKFEKHVANTAKFITYILPFLIISFGSWSSTRYGGIFGNPNVSAHTLILLVPFCLMVPRSRKAYIFIFFSLTLGLISFGSRSALLAVAFGIIGYLISLRIKIKKYKFLLYLVFSVFAIFTSYKAVEYMLQFMDEYRGAVNSSDSRLLYTGYNGRDVIYELALERFSHSKWFGLGFDGAKFEVGFDHILSTHNGFLELLLRLGIIGTALFILLLLVMLWNITKVKDPNLRGVAFMSFLIINSLSTNSSTFFVFNYFFHYVIILYAIALNLKQNKY